MKRECPPPCDASGTCVLAHRGERLQDASRRSADEPTAADQAVLVRQLAEPGRIAPAGARIVETHISYVLLTGDEAYKIKKAVEFPFLDFRTLALRRDFCRAELKLNRRFAPQMYLDVVPIVMTAKGAAIGAAGRVVDYAVRMREFAQDALLCNVLARDAVLPSHIDKLAARIAAFHAAAPVAPQSKPYGDPRRVLQMALDNFVTVSPLAGASERATLALLERWTREEHAARAASFADRRVDSRVRECHGDLHLANVVLVDGEPTLFDCIEFSDDMRWIDTMSEIAYLAMDLGRRGRPDFVHRFVSAYLESSGDYAGCTVLRFYLVYRAMVRAKIACLRAAQIPPGEGRAAAYREFVDYLDLASRYAKGAQRALVVMHGPSGCGKSTAAQFLVERTGAIRIRTDVERKRLAGLPAQARTGSAVDAGLYGRDMTRRTYEQAVRCAQATLEGGFPALIDGAFLRRWQRDLARAHASSHGASFVIVDCVAALATLKARIVSRAAARTDPSEATLDVLAHQLQSQDALDSDELPYTVVCSTDERLAAGAWSERVGRAMTQR